jgi:hypothetical protein
VNNVVTDIITLVLIGVLGARSVTIVISVLVQDIATIANFVLIVHIVTIVRMLRLAPVQYRVRAVSIWQIVRIVVIANTVAVLTTLTA